MPPSRSGTADHHGHSRAEDPGPGRREQKESKSSIGRVDEAAGEGPMGDITARRGRIPLSMHSLLRFRGNFAALALCVQGTCGLVSVRGSRSHPGRKQRETFKPMSSCLPLLAPKPAHRQLHQAHLCAYHGLSMCSPGCYCPMQPCCHKAPL